MKQLSRHPFFELSDKAVFVVNEKVYSLGEKSKSRLDDFYKEKIRWMNVAGLLISFFGVGLVVLNGALKLKFLTKKKLPKNI